MKPTQIHYAPAGEDSWAAGGYAPHDPSLYVVEIGKTPQAARKRLIETFKQLAERLELVKQGS